MDESSVIDLTATGAPALPVIGYDLLTPFIEWLFGVGPLADGVAGILSFLEVLWSVYAILAYVVAAVCLSLYIYASVRKGQLEELQEELIAKAEELYDEQYRRSPRHDRLSDVLTHIATDNPNDWKLAIIEADIILDDTLKRAGFTGSSLGERLRSIAPAQLASLDDAWQAHKVRNQVAHGGADFVLTKRLAEDTIKQYRRVFEELGVR
jgi:hypothetical protein